MFLRVQYSDLRFNSIITNLFAVAQGPIGFEFNFIASRLQKQVFCCKMLSSFVEEHASYVVTLHITEYLNTAIRSDHLSDSNL